MHPGYVKRGTASRDCCPGNLFLCVYLSYSRSSSFLSTRVCDLARPARADGLHALTRRESAGSVFFTLFSKRTLTDEEDTGPHREPLHVRLGPLIGKKVRRSEVSWRQGHPHCSDSSTRSGGLWNSSVDETSCVYCLFSRASLVTFL